MGLSKILSKSLGAGLLAFLVIIGIAYGRNNYIVGRNLEDGAIKCNAWTQGRITLDYNLPLIKNKDMDGNGKYESILVYKDKDGNKVYQEITLGEDNRLNLGLVQRYN